MDAKKEKTIRLDHKPIKVIFEKDSEVKEVQKVAFSMGYNYQPLGDQRESKSLPNQRLIEKYFFALVFYPNASLIVPQKQLKYSKDGKDYRLYPFTSYPASEFLTCEIIQKRITPKQVRPCKPVYSIDKEGNRKEYKSVNAAILELKVNDYPKASPNKIYACIKHYRKRKTAYGLKWGYIEIKEK